MLPQGSVKAKPSSAIGAALGPHLVLPNGNVSGPRACAPVEAFELPGSVARGVPVPGGPAPAAAAEQQLQQALAASGRCVPPPLCCTWELAVEALKSTCEGPTPV